MTSDATSDATFRIGSSHVVCEDYARAGVSMDGNPVAVVSDGCSSSPDTDCGARILVMEIFKAIQELDIEALSYENLYKYSVENARLNAYKMNLDGKCLDATILMLLATPRKIISTCWGDGVIVQRFTSGTIHARIISYPNGFPSYPSYLLEPSREYNRKLMNEVNKRTIILSPNGKININNIHTDDVPLDITLTYFENHNNDPLVAMAIFSDGVLSFSKTVDEETSKTKKPVDIVELLPKLMAFSGKGEFTRRRLNGLMRKEPELSHYDDISMGAIIL
jgi:hypothetical protein